MSRLVADILPSWTYELTNPVIRLSRMSAALGGVDLLFVSAGVARLKSFRQTGKDDWLRALDTNVIGIHRLIANLLDVFDPHAVVAVVSTEAVDSPRSHLGAYGASKAALEHSLAQWREELPTIRFTTISLGATVPTEFGRGFDPDEIMDAMHKWTEAGRNQSTFMDTGEVCDVLTHTLGSLVASPSVGVPLITLRAPRRSPPTPTPSLPRRLIVAGEDLGRWMPLQASLNRTGHHDRILYAVCESSNTVI